jgi:hypothetical protein
MTQFNVFPMPLICCISPQVYWNMVNGCLVKEKDEPYGPRLNMGTQATMLCVICYAKLSKYYDYHWKWVSFQKWIDLFVLMI